MKSNNKQTLSFAFKKSLPVLFGYLFLGSGFGILLYEAGYNWIWAAICSLFVYAGSGQYLLVSLISANASIATVAIMTFLINSRHIFYGISYIEKFKKGKWKYPSLIFSLTDETYSVNSTFEKAPDGIDDASARFYIGIFNHSYWIIGSIMGSLAGQIIPIDFSGIDFSMTAIFIVVFLDLMSNCKGKQKLIGLIGIISAIVCLITFSADSFILPAMIVIVSMLTLTKPIFDTEYDKSKKASTITSTIISAVVIAIVFILAFILPKNDSNNLESQNAILPISRLVLVIAVASAVTFSTRLIPFVVFGSTKEIPKAIKYLGDILPVAIIGALIVYCLSDFTLLDTNIIYPKLIAVSITVLMHLWKRNTLLSIASGTIGYMLLIHFIFI